MSSMDITTGVLALFLIAALLVARELAGRAARKSRLDPVVEAKVKKKLDAKLSSRGLAGLIVQALVDAQLVKAEKAEEAITVAERKIDLRKALGDY
jgi:hypothetical protein